VSINAGLPIWIRGYSHGDGPGAIANEVFVAAILGLAVSAFFGLRRRGRSQREFSLLRGRPVYDKWFAAAAMKPWLALLVLASTRALCHFYARGADTSVEVLVFVVSGATIVWLFVIGPIWRPMNALVCVGGRPGYFEGRSLPYSRGSRTSVSTVDESSSKANAGEGNDPTPSIDSIRTVEFHTTLRGYKMADVDGYLADLASEADALRDRLRQASERIATLERELAQARGAPFATQDAPKHVVDPMF